jgi:hypothetical protein
MTFIQRISQILNRPYYTNMDTWLRIVQAIIFGAFVSLFLLVFEPFQISTMGDNWWLYALGFGLVTLVMMLLLNVLLPKLFKQYFLEESWTLKKEVVQSALNFFCIGAVNCIYFLYLFVGNFSWEVFLRFQFFTLCVGILPIIFFALYKERKDHTRFSETSQSINSTFQAKPHVAETAEGNIIEIVSKNKNENIAIEAGNLLLIKSMDNYLEVYSKGEKQVVRNTLKNVSEDLSGYPHFFRCHKSYLVNLEHVIEISGNAQGYKLALAHCSFEVPVSRSLNEEIKTRLLSLT